MWWPYFTYNYDHIFNTILLADFIHFTHYFNIDRFRAFCLVFYFAPTFQPRLCLIHITENTLYAHLFNKQFLYPCYNAFDRMNSTGHYKKVLSFYGFLGIKSCVSTNEIHVLLTTAVNHLNVNWKCLHLIRAGHIKFIKYKLYNTILCVPYKYKLQHEIIIWRLST